MLGNMIGGFLVIMVGTTLAPTVANSVMSAQMNSSGVVGGVGANLTGASATVLGLTTLFYNLSIASTAIGISVEGLRNAGLM